MEQRYRVTNTCKYAIGVHLSNGQDIAVAPGSFQLMTIDDIVFIESGCPMTKPFSKRMFVVTDSAGKEVDFESLGAYIEKDPVPHMTDTEIENMLKQPIKKIDAWLSQIEDPAELHGILQVAKSMDLTASKLKLLSEKMPEAEVI